MLTLPVTDSYRKQASICNFQIIEGRALYVIMRVASQVLTDGAWSTVGENCVEATIHDGELIDPVTMAIVPEGLDSSPGAPGFQVIMGASPRRLGLEDLDSPVYPAALGQIERYAQANGLV